MDLLLCMMISGACTIALLSIISVIQIADVQRKHEEYFQECIRLRVEMKKELEKIKEDE